MKYLLGCAGTLIIMPVGAGIAVVFRHPSEGAVQGDVVHFPKLFAAVGTALQYCFFVLT